ncbi:PaaI family thioesterase [Patulibacter defluvii]|uniref:PaaI family thioesterase n=1 Tax=Patulibacter defluvii TaxID=3095358 RepID=UPI002A748682|nr:PaaI family thioesterase [Patulibacter sp. DM4]
MSTPEPITDPAAPPADWGAPRQRTVTWFDPLATAAKGAALSGREYLQAMADSELPPAPIASLMGFGVTKIGDGEVEFTGVPDESVYNPIGVVHGGFVATILDSVLGCAVHSTLPAGVGYTSIEMKVNYLRAVHADSGALTARGWVTKPGRRVAFAEADVRDGAGKVVATGSSSLLIIAP